MKVRIKATIKDVFKGKIKSTEREFTIDSLESSGYKLTMPLDVRGDNLVEVFINPDGFNNTQTLRIGDKLIIANGKDPLMYVDLTERKLHKYEDDGNEQV